MKRILSKENPILEVRFTLAKIVIFACLSVICMRLWYVQVYRGEHYRSISKSNRIRKVELPAGRGEIFDRNGQLLLGNRPFFDLVFIPQHGHERKKTFDVLSKLLHIPTHHFEKRMHQFRGRPKYLPVIIKRNLSQHEVSIVQANKIYLPGIDVLTAPRRSYSKDTPAHLVGYLAEIDKNTLNERNPDNVENPYAVGDLIGKKGLESKWEHYLRGKRGYELIQVDAHGRKTSNTKKGLLNLPKIKATPGSNLILTIDKKLQKSVQQAFRGKNGAVIAMSAKTGEILAMTSSPSVHPSRYQKGFSTAEWRELSLNPFHPFLDKTTGGEFPPGSIYKTVVAIAALEEGVITPSSTVNCTGSFSLGDQTYHCHDRNGHGKVNLRRSLLKSCDVFYYHYGVQLGVDVIAKYAQLFNLGEPTGLKLNSERSGLIPTIAWKELTTKQSWKKGETPIISIGQGYNLMTPMQMTNLYAAIGTEGKLFRPKIVKRVIDRRGKVLLENQPELIKEITTVKKSTFRLIKNILKAVVMDKDGTGKKARVPGINIAGKTGSVQVVSLKKNFNANDVSAKWKEHAIFASFAPAEDPEIVVVVVSENDKIGGGGKSAAPVAQKIMASYFNVDISKYDVATRQQLKPLPLKPPQTGEDHSHGN